MSYKINIVLINLLSAEERVFTTAQAERLGVQRNVLAQACRAGKMKRIARGAYRLAGVPPSDADELLAFWKLTAPRKLTEERAEEDTWDGIAVGGATAAALHGFEGFQLLPYRLLSPTRINSRNARLHTGVRTIAREDVSFKLGLPVTTPERTIVDLILDKEETALIQLALATAITAGTFDYTHFEKLLAQHATKPSALRICRELQL